MGATLTLTTFAWVDWFVETFVTAEPLTPTANPGGWRGFTAWAFGQVWTLYTFGCFTV